MSPGDCVVVKRHLLIFACVAVAFITAGCTTTQLAHAPKPVVITEASLVTNLLALQAVVPHLDKLDAEFASIHRPSKPESDFFDAQETNQIEYLLFRFVLSHTVLWDIVDSYGGLDADFPTDLKDTKAHVLSITATLLMASHMAFLVAEFVDQPLVIKQLNQAYFRSEIPFGSYDRMRVDATSPGLLDAVAAVEPLYTMEMADAQSPMVRLAAMDATYAALIAQIPSLQRQAEQRLQEVADYYPSHRKAEQLAKKDIRGQHKHLYALRAFLFKEVSRLKNPSAHIVVFSDAQKQAIFSLLEPGDLILTYTAGYMSDVFIPGSFKHGITYIGSPQERESIGLSVEKIAPYKRVDGKTLATNLQMSSLPDGTRADMIEAVAEGVIFNNLEHIMDTHINRMLVLRPRLSDAERAEFIMEIYSYLGYGYDFHFDFADASQQVCTEVIYRAIDGKGSIKFALTERAGHETLSADDIANYHLNSDAFNFVLLVESTADKDNNDALVFFGPEGGMRLEKLMDATSK